MLEREVSSSRLKAASYHSIDAAYYYIIIILLLHHYYTNIILLLHYYYTIIILLLYYYYTIIILTIVSHQGKFMEIQFNYSGHPDGGKVSNFLLEKVKWFF